MIGMQYKINLPSDYNMEVIRERVKNNGFKTQGVTVSCWLIISFKFFIYLLSVDNQLFTMIDLFINSSSFCHRIFQ